MLLNGGKMAVKLHQAKMALLEIRKAAHRIKRYLFLKRGSSKFAIASFKDAENQTYQLQVERHLTQKVSIISYIAPCKLEILRPLLSCGSWSTKLSCLR